MKQEAEEGPGRGTADAAYINESEEKEGRKGQAREERERESTRLLYPAG